MEMRDRHVVHLGQHGRPAANREDREQRKNPGQINELRLHGVVFPNGERVESAILSQGGSVAAPHACRRDAISPWKREPRPWRPRDPSLRSGGHIVLMAEVGAMRVVALAQM